MYLLQENIESTDHVIEVVISIPILTGCPREILRFLLICEFNESIVGQYKINKIIIGHLCRNTSEQLPKQNKIHICKTLQQTTIEKWLLCTWFFYAGDHTRKLPTKVEFIIGISESALEFPCTCGGLRWKIHLWSCGH